LVFSTVTVSIKLLASYFSEIYDLEENWRGDELYLCRVLVVHISSPSS